jgi:tetratricopeptide (TPR) repeat protein
MDMASEAWAFLEIWVRPGSLSNAGTRGTFQFVSPYRGLAQFQERDADIFFGRNAEIIELHQILLDERVLAIAGDSGSGKSSLLHAGLAPRVRQHGLGGKDGWRIVSLRPGREPAKNLLSALLLDGTGTSGDIHLIRPERTYNAIIRELRVECLDGKRLLLLFDQFEEMQTVCTDDTQRDAVTRALVEMARGFPDSFRVVLGIRSEYLSSSAALPSLKEVLKRPWLLKAPGRDDLRRIISSPAERYGYTFEGPRKGQEDGRSLLDRILHDPLLVPPSREPGAIDSTSSGEATPLPLVEFALERLWLMAVEAESHEFTHNDYEKLGGLAGSVARYASDVYSGLTLDKNLGPSAQDVARKVFLGVVTSRGVRRPRPRAELEVETGHPELAHKVIDRLVGDRLLTVRSDPENLSQALVDLAHEILVRQWELLKEWLDETRVNRKIQEDIKVATRNFVEGKAEGRPESELLVHRGSRLEDAQRLLVDSVLTFTDDERTYIDACRYKELNERDAERFHAKEELRRERGRRRLWAGLTGLMLTMVVLLAVGLVVIGWLRGQEQAARLRADQGEQETRMAMDDMSSEVIDDWLARQPQLTPEQKRFLEKALAYYEKFTQETGQTSEGRAALARAFGRVGVIRRRLGMPEAEAALRQAVKISRELADESPSVPAYQRDAAIQVQNLADLLADRLDHEGTVVLIREAIERQRAALRINPRDTKARQLLVTHYNKLGDGLGSLQKWQSDAEAAYSDALKIAKELAEEFPETRQYQLTLSQVYSHRGTLLTDVAKRRDDAEDDYRKAFRILMPLVAENPFVLEYQRALAQAHYGHARILRLRRLLDKARDAIADALRIYEKLAATFTSVPNDLRHAAQAYNVQANVLRQLTLFDEAKAAHLNAIAFGERLTKQVPDNHFYILDLSGIYNNFGIYHYERDRPSDALPWFDKALAQLKLTRNLDDKDVRRLLRGIYWSQAEALELLDRFSEAARAWKQSITFDDSSRRPLLQARLALALGDYPKAVDAADQQAKADDVLVSNLYDCARVCARAAGAASDPGLRDRAMVSAVELLKRATDGGYSDVERIRKDRYLDAIRRHPRFQEIMEGLEAGRQARP